MKKIIELHFLTELLLIKYMTYLRHHFCHLILHFLCSVSFVRNRYLLTYLPEHCASNPCNFKPVFHVLSRIRTIVAN